MRFVETPIAGAWLIEPAPVEDERGHFTRIFDRSEFSANDLESSFPQWSVSCNLRRGTLRGLHYQADPYGEVKIVRCTAGALFDVVVDLRPDSSSYSNWFAVELTRLNHQALYIPKGVAHGFQTLVDDTEVMYAISTPHHPPAARAVRWNDAAFAIPWPIAEPILSERDRHAPSWEREA